METFRNLKELIRWLSRGQALLADMFSKRKTVAIRYDDAVEVLDGNEAYLQFLINHGVIIRNADPLELDDTYQKFFENVLAINEDINVASVQQYVKTLHLNIGVRVFKSNIIRTQQQYLDILYGNSQSVSRELRRFSIMESAKYQNVPRTIQNIFLNQSLESQVIKDIIIDSMDFADRNNIDLNQIRTEVKDFRMQYDDISKWYRKEKNETVKVRNEADRVLNTYSIYEECRRLSEQQKQMQSAIHDTEGFMASESWPREFAENNIIETVKALSEILSDLKNRVMTLSRKRDSFINAVKQFKANFTPQNTFHFATEFNTESDYANFAANLSEFIGNDMIESYRQRVSDHYARILRTIGIETGNLMSNRSQVQATVNEINRDFRENNFVGVVKEIELRISDSSDRLVQHLLVIKKFNDEHGDSIGEMDLFTDESQRTQNNHRAVELLTMLMDELDADQKRDHVTLADVFKLEFRVRENDNDTGWVERLSNVGSDGTDILVKAMVNIMLINVFKKKVSKRFGDFRLHCMMDEIGKLHPDNVAGILDFANKRNIYLVNSSPTTYNATAYKYTYSLSKDSNNVTVVKTLMTIL